MGTRILVIEDNKANRDLISFVLKPRGYEIVEAADGSEGLRLAREKRPDLIIMDLQMPGLDGLTATRCMREIPELKGVKIIAVTAFAMAGDRETALAAGADEYLPKPINTRELPGVVERMLGRG
jgi:CheY-like chemotaxis protein